MRKRSKYRPKPVLVNPLGYVLESLTPLSKHDSFLIDLKIKIHYAMTNITRGIATRKDIEQMIGVVNISEALYRMGVGREYQDVVKAGADALQSAVQRGVEKGRFVLRASEMNALNTMMELWDEQMDAITVRQLEQAVEMVEEEHRLGKVKHILEK